ncbi:MAG: tetratricopeptide repeat protein [Deltaproteobacteria bacterium]|jgi:tetratricopeptide (TPR) repeat protein|nr:tetratricopeptide repeat protein [Deltaproteobacteria bacterium]
MGEASRQDRERASAAGRGAFWLALAALAAILSGCGLLPQIHALSDPLSPEEHLALGVSYEAAGEMDLAKREYQLAQKIPMAVYYLGNAYFTEGDHKMAERAYRRALRREKIPEALNNLAFLLVMENRNLKEAYRLAAQAVEEGIRQDLRDDLIRNFKNTQNQAEIALGSHNKGESD